MRRLLGYLLVISILLAACGKGGGATDLSQAKPGEKVILSESVQMDGFPASVIPYGAESALAFSDLELSRDGDTIHGKVSYTRQGQGDFTLVVYLSMADQLLIGYLDPEATLALALPSGTVLFGADGFQNTGDQAGTIEFSLAAKAFNGYNVSGQNGTAYIFSVPGTVNAHSFLPGDQTDPQSFQANSNVRQGEFGFQANA